jgi:cytoskeleton protein RodZ
MPTIGQTLKESREKQKISIDVAAKAVKVKTELLEDIEKDDFSRFAASIYARGILRLYASFLGLEPESIVEEYNKINPDARKGKPSGDAVDLGREDLIERRRAMVISTVSKPSDLSPRGVFGLIAVAIFLGVSIWVLSSSRKSQPDATPSLAPRMIEAPKPADPNPAPAPATVSPGVILPTPAFTNSATNAVSAIPAVEVTPEEEPAPPSPPGPPEAGSF